MWGKSRHAVWKSVSAQKGEVDWGAVDVRASSLDFTWNELGSHQLHLVGIGKIRLPCGGKFRVSEESRCPRDPAGARSWAGRAGG